MLKDAKAFYNLGFSLHLLHSNSKRPIDVGWSKSPKKSWDEIQKAYRPGMNLGVVLGEKSQLKGTKKTDFLPAYLGVIDCDVKGIGHKYEKELNEKLKELIGVPAPTVLSGRGNGSRHIYFRSPKPFSPFSFFKSKEKVKVLMPSVEPSGNDIKALTPDELKRGYRVRPAWEISVMSTGQQVVLPPSIHPDTKKPYAWVKPLKDIDDLPILDFSKHIKDKKAAESPDDFLVMNWADKDVPVGSLPVDKKYKLMVKTGEGVEDRSAAIYAFTLHALHQNVGEKEIVNVLTNPKYYLGQVAYDHAKTKNRERAARWVIDHTLKKALKEFDFSDAFDDTVEIKKLDAEDTAKQSKKMDDDKDTVGDWRDELIRRQDDGAPKACHFNISLILKKTIKNCPAICARNLFSFDDNWLTSTPWGSKKGELVTDDDIVRIKDFLSKKYRMDTGRDKINDAISAIALENAYHPVRNFLDNLEWDGKERLQTWLKDYLGAKGDKEVLDCFGTRTLIGMVRRIYEPGCKFDTVLILEGDQDIGKSTTARILAGEDWFSDSDINIGDKDAVVSMNGNWIIELAELAALSKRDSESLKQFITRQVDKIRPHYGKRLMAYPRQSVFFGSTNNDEYLKDPTGNRRYWPVKVTEVNFKTLRRDRDQLLAEAKELYKMGFPSYLDPRTEPDLYKKVQREQAKRMEHDELETMIGEALNSEESLGVDPNSFRITDLFASPALNGVRNDRQGQMRVANLLKKMGFKKVQKMVNKVKGIYWQKSLPHLASTPSTPRQGMEV